MIRHIRQTSGSHHCGKFIIFVTHYTAYGTESLFSLYLHKVQTSGSFYSKINYIIIYFFTFQLSNLFFISLAVADLLLSALVMPFAIVNDLTGEWKFGKDYCNLWISTDVMCCTASITSLLAISLER